MKPKPSAAAHRNALLTLADVCAVEATHLSLVGVPQQLIRSAMYATNEHGVPVNRIPRGGGIPVKVRAGLQGTHSTAHGGTIGDVRIDESAATLRAAHLTPEQAATVRAVLLVANRPAPFSWAAVARIVGCEPRAAYARYARALKAIRAVEAAVEAMR